jgi:hypothetical protein
MEVPVPDDWLSAAAPFVPPNTAFDRQLVIDHTLKAQHALLPPSSQHTAPSHRLHF